MQALYSSIPLPLRKRIPVPVFVFFALALIAALAEVSRFSINNYLIFKQVFWHTVEQVNLYAPYPTQHEDTNHYGPFFSAVIAPFALLPTGLGAVLWVLFTTAFLFVALQDLPLNQRSVLTILLLVAVEHMTAAHNMQSNSLIAAWIILAYTLVRREKDGWAALLVVAGTMVKLYGIVGIAFFLFSKHKGKYMGGLLFWSAVCFVLPMAFSSPAFIVQSYGDWYHSLVEKNGLNTVLKFANMQDISLMGMIRRIFRLTDMPNLAVLAPGALLLGLPLLRFGLYRNSVFQLYYLALILISVVIFSSSAESSTYVIAVCGVAIWFVLNSHHNRKWDLALLLFVIVLTILSPTDLFPKAFKRAYITNYALKALPCVLVWCVLVWKLLTGTAATFKSPVLHEA